MLNRVYTTKLVKEEPKKKIVPTKKYTCGKRRKSNPVNFTNIPIFINCYYCSDVARLTPSKPFLFLRVNKKHVLSEVLYSYLDGLSILKNSERWKRMEKSVKYVLAVVIIVVLVVAVYAYIAYQGVEEFEGGDLVDDMGYSLTLTSPPERIVSLAPSNTEILFAVGAGDKVVGVTDFCNYPYDFAAWVEAGNMTSIGNFRNPSVEPIVALAPDLVLVSTGSLDTANNLRSLGYTVFTPNPKNLADIMDNIIKVGKATGHKSQAASVVNDMQQRIDIVINGVKNATTRPKVYVESWNNPYISVGQETFINDLIKLAGGQNIFENATIAYPTVSSEAIIE